MVWFLYFHMRGFSVHRKTKQKSKHKKIMYVLLLKSTSHWVFIPIYEPSGARGGTGCRPHNSSVFTLAGAAPALYEDNTARQRPQLKWSGTSHSTDLAILASQSGATPISLLLKWLSYSKAFLVKMALLVSGQYVN